MSIPGSPVPMLAPPSSRSVPVSKLHAFTARFTELWWVEIPGRLRRYSTLLWAAWSDGIYLTAWPRVATMLPIAVLMFGLFEGATHWTFVSPNPSGGHWDWGITYVGHGSYAWVFAQILPLLILAAVLGSLSANLGLTLATGYFIGDFLFVDEQWGHHDVITRFFHFHIPQLICYLLFLLLAVWPAVCTKFLVAGLHRRLREKVDRLHAILTAIVLGLFVYEWTYMAPMVFRVAWVWQAGIASPSSVALFQSFMMPWLVTTAVAGVLLRHWLSNRAESTDPGGLGQRSEALIAQAETIPSRRRPWLYALLGAAYMTLLVAGFLDSIVIGVLIFATISALLLARSYLLPQTRAWDKWCRLVSNVPPLLRVAAVAVGGYFITLLVLSIPGFGAAQNPKAGQFGAEVLALLIGFLFMLVLLPNGVLPAEEPTASPRDLGIAMPSTVVQVGFIVAFALLATKKALAQGVCADPGCCFGGDNNLAAASTGGTLPSGTAGDPGSGRLHPDPRGEKSRQPSGPPKGHGKSGDRGKSGEGTVEDPITGRQVPAQTIRDRDQGDDSWPEKPTGPPKGTPDPVGPQAHAPNSGRWVRVRGGIQWIPFD